LDGIARSSATREGGWKITDRELVCDRITTMLLAIYLTVLVGFNVPLLLLRYKAVREVNEHRSEKLSMWISIWRLWSDHKREVPESRVRFYYHLTFVLAVLWMFSGFQILQWARR